MDDTKSTGPGEPLWSHSRCMVSPDRCPMSSAAGARPNAWLQGCEAEPHPGPRHTYATAALADREHTEEVVALMDQKQNLDFAGKVWSVGTIFREASDEERKALLGFVNEQWGGK